MKYYLFFFMVISLTFANCTPHKTSQVFEFRDSIYYFDTIQAQKEDYCFRFTCYNRGDSPLYLTEVKGECSCTYAEFSTDALIPGDSAQIDVYYQSYLQSFDVIKKLKVKYFYKDIEDEKTIRIKGYVIPRVLDFDL